MATCSGGKRCRMCGSPPRRYPIPDRVLLEIRAAPPSSLKGTREIRHLGRAGQYAACACARCSFAREARLCGLASV
eukprot:scaffold1051_cov254-Pinguiococcus_pyrenoidosus.AAC.5